jgi:murein DD-endopeptidase MepM/ murein hydrolase activator NlpD
MPSEKKRLKRKQIKKRLFTKNRLVILNDESFEEVFSLRLTLMNVFVVATIGAVLLILVTTYIIAFTPLREFIPGYASTKLKRDATELALKSDSLSVSVKNNEAYLNSIKRVLTGDLDVARLSKDSITAASVGEADQKAATPSDAETALRAEVSRQDKYNLFESAQPAGTPVLFAPVKGIVTEHYSPRIGHFSVDVALARNTAIKSVLPGTVIFSGWTPDGGNVIIVRHTGGFISVSKHAASLTKSAGDAVRTGEVLALAGNTGSESTGVHLHFELWKDGYPVNPETFMSFE